MNSEGSSGALDVTVREFVKGQKLVNRYTLKQVLGRGGMGVVWLARDDVLERDVALKFLPDLVLFDRSMLNELKRETNRSLELTHKNIVRIYDFVHDETSGCISMEYIDGDTLSNMRIDRPNKVFECWELDNWTKQLCEALDYAHNHAQVVHRDLKPANLMVNQRGELKVADFGIARSVSEAVSMLTMGRHTSGTLVYMSPQQLDGGRSTPLDDVYSVGATLYELLTSKPPFYSGNVDRQIHERIPPSMKNRREELDVAGEPIDQIWEDVVATCLQKDPALRPQSALEIVRLLTAPSPAPAPIPKTSRKVASWLRFPSSKTEEKTAPSQTPSSHKTRPKTEGFPTPRVPTAPRTPTALRAPTTPSVPAAPSVPTAPPAPPAPIAPPVPTPPRLRKRRLRRAALACVRAGRAMLHGIAAAARFVGNDFRESGLLIMAATRAVARVAQSGLDAIGKILYSTGKGIVHGAWFASVAVVKGLSGLGIALITGSRAIFRGSEVTAIALARETVRGIAITIIPAVVVAAGVWFFAIRTPPPQQMVKQPLPNPPQIVAQPKPSLPPVGGLLVETSPAGATVTVDGSTKGTSPATFSNLPVGKHHLQIVLPEYKTEEREIDVTGGAFVSSGVIGLNAIPRLEASPAAKPVEPVTNSPAATPSEPVANRDAQKEDEQKNAATKKTSRKRQVAASRPEKSTPPAGRQVAAAPRPTAPKIVPKPAATPKPNADSKKKTNPAFGEGVPGG